MPPKDLPLRPTKRNPKYRQRLDGPIPKARDHYTTHLLSIQADQTLCGLSTEARTTTRLEERTSCPECREIIKENADA